VADFLACTQMRLSRRRYWLNERIIMERVVTLGVLTSNQYGQREKYVHHVLGIANIVKKNTAEKIFVLSFQSEGKQTFSRTLLKKLTVYIYILYIYI
jgi:hypothetical protein